MDDNISAVFIGKFSPLHKGHITSIIKSASMVDLLYIVCSYNEEYEKKLFSNTIYEYQTLKQKLQCLEEELSLIPNIKIIGLDEENIAEFPDGLEEWLRLFRKSFTNNIDCFFGGEPQYENFLKKYYPNSKYITIDKDRTEINISSTMLRETPYKYWEFIPKSVCKYFTFRVLIIGGESSGKTTLTNILGKYYKTQISTETGRAFSERFGGHDDLIEHRDFEIIAYEKLLTDNYATANANKITFFDTDIITTQYYCELYTGGKNNIVESMIKNSSLEYNLIIALPPNISHVMDRQREFSSSLHGGTTQEIREKSFQDILKYYNFYGYNDIVILEGVNYEERLKNIIDIINEKLS